MISSNIGRKFFPPFFMESSINDNIILFDGDCNLCNRTIRFISKRNNNFKLVPMQGELGSALKTTFNIKPSTNSVILLQKKTVYTESTAVLRIIKGLKGPIKLLCILVIFPKPIVDYLYKIVARNRYKWFGKTSECNIG